MRNHILVLCLLAFFLSTSLATTAKLKHHAESAEKTELLQTKSQTDSKVSTSTETTTESTTETNCDPDCLFDYPYNEGGCKTEPVPPSEPESSDGGEDLPPGGGEEHFPPQEPPVGPPETTGGEGGEEPPLTGYEGEGPYEPIPPTTNEESGYGGEEEPPLTGYEGEGPSEPIPPISSEEFGFGETVIPPGDGGYTEENPEEPSPPIEVSGECAYTSSIQSGTTTAYGQPTTYLTYTIHDSKSDEDVSYTYVLTTIYSGTVQNGPNDYVVYGTGAINFYNTYYGVNDYVTDQPGCSCVCGYSSYTFSYSFDF